MDSRGVNLIGDRECEYIVVAESDGWHPRILSHHQVHREVAGLPGSIERFSGSCIYDYRVGLLLLQ